MSSFYHGYDMSGLKKYTINCKDCPKKVNVFKATKSSIPKPKKGNIGKYYYSCNETNKECKCKFFRWFEHKWPKVKEQYQNMNLEPESDEESDFNPINEEMHTLIEQLKYIDIEELSAQDKIEISSLVTQLEKKINSSKINIIKKSEYLKTLDDLKKIV